MNFTTHIDLQPLPVSTSSAARQALYMQAKVSRYMQAKVSRADSVDAAVSQAVNAIYAASPTDAPSELKRLRLLYQKSYTREELEGLVRNTFKALGIKT